MTTTGQLVINTTAVVENWQYLNRKSHRAECAAVVKANAYGLGVEAISKALSGAGCQTFFVSTLNEALELRTFLPLPLKIIVLGGLAHDTSSMGCLPVWQSNHLIPVLFDKKHISRWAEHCSARQCELPSAVKIDTGMHRLGMSPGDLLGCLGSGGLSSAYPAYLMSHFACADQSPHPMNQQQIKDFQDCALEVKRKVPNIKLSLANSGGVFLGEQAAFDLVRPGVALYGGNPVPSAENPMSSVVQLRLPIMQIKTINVGESVGYGAQFVAQRATCIAIVFGGYADGLLRCLGGSGFVYCRGKKAPVIGRVSMDSMAIDITDVVTSVSADDLGYVEILGQEQTLDDVARAAGTIAYEILTSLGSRYQRVYTQNVDEAV